MSTTISTPSTSSQSPSTERAPRTTPTVDQYLDNDHAAIQQMEDYARATSLPFLCVDLQSGTILGKTADDFLALLPATVFDQIQATSGARVIQLPSGLAYYALPLPEADGVETVAVGYVLSQTDACPSDVIMAAAEDEWSQGRLEEWISRQQICQPELLERLLTLAMVQEGECSQRSELEQELDQLGVQIEHTYEEISLLHSLTQNLQISRSPIDVADLCLSRMQGLIHAEGNAIWLEKKRDGKRLLVQGEIPFDEIEMSQFLTRFDGHDWSKPLVKNNVSGTLLGYDFPGLKNFVVVSISEGPHRLGWIMNCNLTGGGSFGTVEASLLNSIATILGTHLRNIDLYEEHKDLLLGLVKSFVSTLDAKDPYTCGHSERVALIARRLGEQLELPKEDLEIIYQSGLLHDIGKIGVDDRILRKSGRLTDEEFDQIKLHPMIGYTILSGLKNLKPMLPGVRSHHENYTGNGYPDGLVGEEIPLMARILAVADAYDAMCSDRPYRKGMPLEKVESIFQDGSGKQWDSRIIEAYFAARDDISRISEEYSKRNHSVLHDDDSE